MAEEGYVLPAIIPDTPEHRLHMSSWCNGTALRPSGGVGLAPWVGGPLHLRHMAAYCEARAPNHSLTSELWAGGLGPQVEARFKAMLGFEVLSETAAVPAPLPLTAAVVLLFAALILALALAARLKPLRPSPPLLV